MRNLSLSVVQTIFSISVTSILMISPLTAQQYTRGVGVYPGDPAQYDGAIVASAPSTYRDLALYRPAYASSSYDYNLTPQLVTDGVRDTRMPRWITAATSEAGLLPKNVRGHLVDDNPVSSVDIPASGGWVELDLDGGDAPLQLDRVDVSVRPQSDDHRPQAWTCIILGSPDHKTWTEQGRASRSDALASPTPWLPFFVKTSVKFPTPTRDRFFRVELQAAYVSVWGVGDLALFDHDQRVEVGGPFQFTSAWKSAGGDEQWIYVDLGGESTFDHLILYWIRPPAEGSIQVSDDAQQWQTIQALPTNGETTEDIKLAQPAHGRYVRVRMARPVSERDGYVLSEFEVYGRGGAIPEPQPAMAVPRDGILTLSRGSWRLQRTSLVSLPGEALSQPGFSDQDWLPATVPGTVLSAYLDDGAIPDPNYGDNQLMISGSYFYSDFWYRDTFTAPTFRPNQHVWLNFEGINWKADVFLNGQKLGQVAGGFTRARFDVTSLLKPGALEALAVLIHRNDHPGGAKQKTLLEPDWNGGALGADNPTFHASIGWDWIPTIRGRNTGMWGNVYLGASGPVTIEQPFVTTTLPLPDTSRADVTVQTTLQNHEDTQISGILRGQFGKVKFERRINLPGRASETITFDPSNTPALRLRNPKLWWPNGYGDPNLYDVKLTFETGHHMISDSKELHAGVRQFTYSSGNGPLKIWVNGRRFIPRGGNWGFPESMLRYRSREYDIAVRYHREMNFNMIRNWVGQTPDDAFFNACDKYGIVVWEDFWLANPWDGPDPENDSMFLQNASDFIARLRNHPSIGLFVGRNEGFPPKALEEGLTDLISKLDPAIHYIPNSAFGAVSGGGPYHAMPRKFYFEQRATPKLHSELGMPSIPTLDSVKEMMPASDVWPISEDWGLHDFSAHGAAEAGDYEHLIASSYGPASSAAEWVELAQFENYDGYRAMFEAQSKNRMGMLIWMSHPAWPSFVWQTYDYYFEPNASYFGTKKACEPLHIQWNPVTDNVEVVNYSAGAQVGLTAQAEILNMDGSVQWQKSAMLDSQEDSVATPIKLEYPANLSAVHFIRLMLRRGDDVISRNFYWRGVQDGTYEALRQMPKVNLQISTKIRHKGDEWLLATELKNVSRSPGLMIRVKAVREKSGDRILPAYYNDNYIALMPEEERTIQTTLEDADTRGERPRIVVEGFNLAGGSAR